MPSLGTSPYAARADHDHSPLPAPDAPDAGDVAFTPAGSIAAANVQDAVEEVASEAATGLSNHTGDATDAHDASAISVLDTAGNFTGTEVETVLDELFDAITAGGIPATVIDAVGDLIVGDAADSVDRLPVSGTDGWVLTEDSGEALGMKWAAGGSGGFVGARAYNNAAQTVTAATETTVLYNSEEYDTSAIHDTGSTTGRLTVPTGMDGYWRFTSHVSIIGTHGIIYFYLRKDGTTAIIGSEIDVATATTDYSGVVSVLVNLAAAQYVETRAYRATGTTFGNNVNGTMCSMEAEFLGV